jgi:Fe-S-cluster containining protein
MHEGSPGADRPPERDQLGAAEFACRDDCGLCCFAAPAVTPVERARLLAIAPEESWSGPIDQIPSRPLGGSCRYLTKSRCSVHTARPFPCRSFPVLVHLGRSAHATVVLSCPGLATEAIVGHEEPGGTAVPASLAAEWEAVRAELSRVPPTRRRRLQAEWDHAIERTGAATREGDVAIVAAVAAETFDLQYAGSDAELSGLPREEEGLEYLPLAFHPRYGRIGFAATAAGVDVVSLRERGGIEDRLGTFAWPRRAPRLEPGAHALLHQYLRFVADRPAFLGAAMAMVLANGALPLDDQLREDAASLAAAVLLRGRTVAMLNGASGETLTRGAILDGIRASDADVLDRPTVGEWL